jgi:hypothetical protein
MHEITYLISAERQLNEIVVIFVPLDLSALEHLETVMHLRP